MQATVRDTALIAVALALAATFVCFVAVSLLALVIRVTPGDFARALTGPIVGDALVLSVKTSTISALVAAIFGTPLAAVLARPFRGRAVLETLVTLPVVLPPVVGGLALLLAFSRAGLLGHTLDLMGVQLPFTTAAVVMAQTFVAAPLYIAVATSAFARADRGQLEAAATLRAGTAYTFLRVVLPPASPALVAGLLLCWARALGEFGATITFAGNLPGVTQTMPVAVYTIAQTDLQAAITVAVVLMVLSYLALLIVRRMAGGPAVGL